MPTSRRRGVGSEGALLRSRRETKALGSGGGLSFDYGESERVENPSSTKVTFFAAGWVMSLVRGRAVDADAADGPVHSLWTAGWGIGAGREGNLRPPTTCTRVPWKNRFASLRDFSTSRLDVVRGLAPPHEIHERPQPLLLLFFV